MTWSIDDILKLFTVVGVLLTVFVSLFTATQAASKTGFEQLEKLVDKLNKKIEELEAQAEKDKLEKAALERRVTRFEQENEDLREWAEALVKQVEEAGKVPAPFRHRTHPRDKRT